MEELEEGGWLGMVWFEGLEGGGGRGWDEERAEGRGFWGREGRGQGWE